MTTLKSLSPQDLRYLGLAIDNCQSWDNFWCAVTLPVGGFINHLEMVKPTSASDFFEKITQADQPDYTLEQVTQVMRLGRCTGAMGRFARQVPDHAHLVQ